MDRPTDRKGLANALTKRPVLGAADAARLLGVSRQTIIRWAEEGEIAAFRTRGGHYRFKRAEVEEYIRRQEVK